MDNIKLMELHYKSIMFIGVQPEEVKWLIERVYQKNEELQYKKANNQEEVRELERMERKVIFKKSIHPNDIQWLIRQNYQKNDELLELYKKSLLNN